MARMQIVAREAVPTREEDYRARRREEARGPLPRSSICFAFLEVRPGELTDETFVLVRHSRGRTGMTFSVDPTPQPMDERWNDEGAYPYDHVDGCLIRMTVRSEGFDNLLGIGKLLVRRTTMPVADGMEGFVCSGILLRTSAIPDGTMIRLEGEDPGRMTETAREVIEDAFPTGGVPRDVLSRPLWGFSDGPRGFGSTFPIEVASTCDRWSDLAGMESRSEDEEREYVALTGHPAVRSIYQGFRDAEYASFLETYRSSPAWSMRTRLTDCPTAAELAEAHRRSVEAFQEWYASRDSGARRP